MILIIKIMITIKVVAASAELWGIFQPYAHLSSCRTAKVLEFVIIIWWYSIMIVKRISLDYYGFYWSWHPQGSLTVPKCLNIASSDGVRLSATVKSLEKSLTQVLLTDFTKLWSHVHVVPGLVDHVRGVEGGVGDVGDCGEPVLRQVLPALGVGHPCQGEEHSQYEKNDHYDYIVIITIAMVSHHCYDTKAVFFVHHFY